MTLLDEFDSRLVSEELIRYVDEPADGAKIIRRQRVTLCRPWCDQCGSWQGEELHYDDQTVWTICVCCRSPLDTWPEEPKEKKP